MWTTVVSRWRNRGWTGLGINSRLSRQRPTVRRPWRLRPESSRSHFFHACRHCAHYAAQIVFGVGRREEAVASFPDKDPVVEHVVEEKICVFELRGEYKTEQRAEVHNADGHLSVFKIPVKPGNQARSAIVEIRQD